MAITIDNLIVGNRPFTPIDLNLKLNIDACNNGGYTVFVQMPDGARFDIAYFKEVRPVDGGGLTPPMYLFHGDMYITLQGATDAAVKYAQQTVMEKLRS